MSMREVKNLAEEIHQLAWCKGWHSKTETEDAFVERTCNNLHDEVSELHEAWRNNRLRLPCDKAKEMLAMNMKPLTCLEEELADIVIRVFDNAEKLGVDIDAAIRQKHAFNAMREIRHGGKRS